ncbi:MAG TPA: UDP-glucose/GDP-mannose dehydrogenase family protein [Candidatus Saccharimonadales bacterium]|nr:UDP-glucose/GDP-mannose dehydrogenase family protein [Candidatus Saccharimonadales bacterium]
MKVAVVGTGYVGLVTGTCLAEKGNDVTCVDIDANKIKRMQGGEVLIYEPGLETVFERNVREGRLHFTTELMQAVEAEVIFLALPTPPGEDGAADLSYVLSVANDLGPLLKHYTVIVDKSTVPVGTSKLVREHVGRNARVEFDVVSNPEFLREGQAVADFLEPERVVVGTSSERAASLMTRLYKPFVENAGEQNIIVMDEASAELTKYAANALLATKISYMNELSALCEATGADITKVRVGIGTDSRIGSQFLHVGPGYGGSCFPKDTLALLRTATDFSIRLGIVQATIDANERQKEVLPGKISRYYEDEFQGRTFALWGLAFKDNTDDVRESPALAIVQKLTEQGAKVVAFDSQAMGNFKRVMSGNALLSFADDEYAVLNGADALVIATNWGEFVAPDFDRIKSALKEPVIFDGRNLYDPKAMQAAGFYYESIGRKTAKAD